MSDPRYTLWFISSTLRAFIRSIPVYLMNIFNQILLIKISSFFYNSGSISDPLLTYPPPEEYQPHHCFPFDDKIITQL